MKILISAPRQAELDAVGVANNPFLSWNNLAQTGISSGTGTLSGGDRENAFAQETYKFWRPDISATTAVLAVEFPVAETVSFAGLVAHNIGTLGARVRVQYSGDGVSWSDAGAGEAQPLDDRPIGFRMATAGQDAAHWRFYFSGLSAGAPLAVGVAFLGREVIVPQRVYSGFVPAVTPTEVNLQSNVSQGGNLIGSSVISKGSRYEVEFSHIPAGFFRSVDWVSFQSTFNAGTPALFGWRPEEVASDLHYIWRDGPVIRPEPMGLKDLMSVIMAARGYEG